MSATHSDADHDLRALGGGVALEALATSASGDSPYRRRLRTVALLDLDPDLGGGMDPDRFAVARHEIRTTLLRLPRGEWPVAQSGSVSCPDVGLLLLDGIVAREIMLEDTISTELLGPGDLIRPWSEDEQPYLLRQRVRWQVLAEVRIAVLGKAFANALLRFPEVNAALLDRASARSRRLATTQAISHLNSVERRLCALLWHLAERWGRVSADGVVVPLTLSHRLLGELIGARRPTVSTALAALERQGTVKRREDATWLLVGEPPGAPENQLWRVVSHRRRLVSQEPPALSIIAGRQAR